MYGRKSLLAALAVILLIGLLVTACGGGDETATTAAPATTAASTATTAAPTETTASQEAIPLKVGVLVSQTGFMTMQDAYDEADTKLVAQLINEKYPLVVQGQKYSIELPIVDCKSTLDGYATAATKLVSDGVKFVVGPNAFFSIGSTPVLEAAKVLHVSGYNTLQPGEMSAETPYAFLAYNNPMAQMICDLDALTTQYPDVKNVALWSADDPSADLVLAVVKEQAPKYGVTLVGDVVKFPNETEDYNPIAAQLNAIEGADAYMQLLASVPADAAITKGLRALGNNKPIICSAFAADFIALAGAEASNDVITLLSFTAGEEGNPPEVEEIYAMGEPGRPWFGCIPTALWELAYVIRAADSIDPDAVKAKWESLDTISTVYGEGFLCGDETYGLPNHAVAHPIPYAKIINAEIIPCGWTTVDATAIP